MKLTVVALSVVASSAMLLAFLASLAALPFPVGPPGCAQDSELYLLSRLLVPIICFLSTVWFGVLARRPDGRRFLFALTLPGAALLLVWGVSMVDAATLKRCAEIDPGVYGRDTPATPASPR
jgi:hypothetical protein